MSGLWTLPASPATSVHLQQEKLLPYHLTGFFQGRFLLDSQLPMEMVVGDREELKAQNCGPAQEVSDRGARRFLQVSPDAGYPAFLFLGNPRPCTAEVLTETTRRRALPRVPVLQPLVHESVTTCSALLPHKPGPGMQRQGAEGSHRRTLWASATHSATTTESPEHRVAWGRVWFSHPLATGSRLQV